ncbi:MAG: SLC13 family permease [Bacteroidaceae bacterium]|nr:SLC13 family permease [Bacteroidaceae bacterium]
MLESLLHEVILGVSIGGWVTILAMICIFVVMAKSNIPAEVAFLGALTVLLVLGIVDEEEGLAGFSSEPVVVNAAFFVIIGGLMQTGVLYWLTKNVLGEARSFTEAIIKLMIPTSILSAFLSSSNVVSLLIDAVKIWSRKLSLSPSKLLMPLSYAASLGGMCTLLGNSSNLVVAGLYTSQTGEQLNIFAPMLPGIILTVIGMLLVMLLQRLIPDRKSSEVSFESTSDYTVELLVPTDNPHVMETVEEAGLYNPKGGSLIEIMHFDREIVMPVPKDEYVMGGDRLIYAGQINDLLELKRTHGLVAADHHVWSIDEIDTKRRMRTAYVTFGSELIGKSMTHSSFERRNNVVLVAVARQGHRVEGLPREISLQAGDTLLLECPAKGESQLEQANRRSLKFFDSHFVPQLGPKTVTSAIVLTLMFLISTFKILPLITASMLAAGVLMMAGCCHINGVTKYIEWDLLLILGSTVVFSVAITNTGVASFVATNVLELCHSNPYIVMAVMCLLASIVSEFISDVGAGAVFFPIMYQQALLLDCNPMPFVMSLMLSVALSFASPIGSSTHMLVYGPGSYRFTDFARLGTIMHLVLLPFMLLIVSLIYPFH